MNARQQINMKQSLSRHIGYVGCEINSYAKISFTKFCPPKNGNRNTGFFVIFIDDMYNEYTAFIPENSQFTKILNSKSYFSFKFKVKKHTTYNKIAQTNVEIVEYDDTPVYKLNHGLAHYPASYYYVDISNNAMHSDRTCSFLFTYKFLNHVINTVCEIYKVPTIPAQLALSMVKNIEDLHNFDKVPDNAYFRYSKYDNGNNSVSVEVSLNNEDAYVYTLQFIHLGGLQLLEKYMFYTESMAILNAIGRSNSKSW